MKRFNLLFVFLFCITSLFAQNFEGTIKTIYQNANEVGNGNWLIKGTNFIQNLNYLRQGEFYNTKILFDSKMNVLEASKGIGSIDQEPLKKELKPDNQIIAGKKTLYKKIIEGELILEFWYSEEIAFKGDLWYSFMGEGVKNQMAKYPYFPLAFIVTDLTGKQFYKHITFQIEPKIFTEKEFPKVTK